MFKLWLSLVMAFFALNASVLLADDASDYVPYADTETAISVATDLVVEAVESVEVESVITTIVFGE